MYFHVKFLIVIISLVMFNGSVLATTEEDLIKKLESDIWYDLFYNKGELQKYKKGDNFKKLVEVAENKGLDWHIRIKAIKLLSVTSNIAVPDILINMLYDPFFNHECPAIKSSVAEALGNFSNDSRVVDALLYSMNDGEIQVREASIDALGKIRNKKAIPALLKIVDDKSIALRIAAIRSLGMIGDSSALNKLTFIAEKDAINEIRSTAKDAIERIVN